MKIKLMILFVGVTLLAACSGGGAPELIAAQPAGEAIATFPMVQPPPGQVVYNAILELGVAHVDQAADKAKGVAFDHSGYLVNAQSWYQEGEKHTMLILAVPAAHFEAARNRLLRLGSLVSESVSGDLSGGDGSQWTTYSHITVYLRPLKYSQPDLAVPKRRPLVTLTKAWEVFLYIFGFILDVIIWVTVVGGPFLLIGWMVLKLLRRRQRRRKQAP